MKWFEIKESIKNDLLSRGLKDPSIRLRALDNIEAILKRHYEDYISSPELLRSIKKNDFKAKVEKYKSNMKLNSAEESVINEIYYRI